MFNFFDNDFKLYAPKASYPQQKSNVNKILNSIKIIEDLIKSNIAIINNDDKYKKKVIDYQQIINQIKTDIRYYNYNYLSSNNANILKILDDIYKDIYNFVSNCKLKDSNLYNHEYYIKKISDLYDDYDYINCNLKDKEIIQNPDVQSYCEYLDDLCIQIHYLFDESKINMIKKNIDIKSLKDSYEYINKVINEYKKLINKLKNNKMAIDEEEKSIDEPKTQEIKQSNYQREDIKKIEKDNDWELFNSYKYQKQNKDNTIISGFLNIYKQDNNDSRLLKFEFVFDNNNYFSVMIKKDYNIVNLYFENNGFDPLFKYDKLEYIKLYSENLKFYYDEAYKILEFMANKSDDFYKFVQNRGSSNQEGIKEIQQFIDNLKIIYSNVPNIDKHIKRIFTDLINHEYIEKNSLDYDIVYNPINQLKKKYNDPQIWKLNNFKI